MFPELSLKQSIKNFLTAESLNAPVEQPCPNCGSIMQHLTATFTFGDGESWDIELPFCSNCERGHRIAS
jgi:hypothetical protein